MGAFDCGIKRADGTPMSDWDIVQYQYRNSAQKKFEPQTPADVFEYWYNDKDDKSTTTTQKGKKSKTNNKGKKNKTGGKKGKTKALKNTRTITGSVLQGEVGITDGKGTYHLSQRAMDKRKAEIIERLGKTEVQGNPKWHAKFVKKYGKSAGKGNLTKLGRFCKGPYGKIAAGVAILASLFGAYKIGENVSSGGNTYIANIETSSTSKHTSSSKGSDNCTGTDDMEALRRVWAFQGLGVGLV